MHNKRRIQKTLDVENRQGSEKMNRMNFEMLLLEEQVSRALEDELILSNTIFHKNLTREEFEKESVCQGVTDNVSRRVWAIFKQVQRICFLPADAKRRHVVLLIQGEENYIVDGTIRQFLPNETKKVFKQKDYPLEVKKLQTWERGSSQAVFQLTPKKGSEINGCKKKGMKSNEDLDKNTRKQSFTRL